MVISIATAMHGGKSVMIRSVKALFTYQIIITDFCIVPSVMPPKRKGPQPALVAGNSTNSLSMTINVPTTRFYVHEDGQLCSSTTRVQVVLDDANYQHHNPTLDFDAPLEFGASDAQVAPSLSSINDAFAELAAIDPAYFDELDEITLGPRKK